MIHSFINFKFNIASRVDWSRDLDLLTDMNRHEHQGKTQREVGKMSCEWWFPKLTLLGTRYSWTLIKKS